MVATFERGSIDAWILLDCSEASRSFKFALEKASALKSCAANDCTVRMPLMNSVPLK